MESASLRKEPAIYRVGPLAGKGSMSGINPQPETSRELLDMCRTVLNALACSSNEEELGHGLLAMSYGLTQFKKAKIEELKS